MILLAIGSNLSSSYGDRFNNIDLAISYLKSYKINLLRKSSYYESSSYPDETKPKFINVVIEVSTNLNAEDLASVLIFVEEKLERKRKEKNDPRTCDIDIIDFNGEIKDFEYNNSIFTVPHKHLSYRNFVLLPLMEISPNWIHPKTNESITMLFNKLSDEKKNSILKVKKS
jgi:2-amino-4-hydroxy-6-hydroxymethyldihydropteridine diphosphokinase